MYIYRLYDTISLLHIDNYSTGDYSSDAYAALCEVDYEIKDINQIPEGAFKTGKGVVTWVNMQNFASSVVDFLEIAYDEVWGSKADKVASMIVSEPFDKLLDGEYSGRGCREIDSRSRGSYGSSES